MHIFLSFVLKYMIFWKSIHRSETASPKSRPNRYYCLTLQRGLWHLVLQPLMLRCAFLHILFFFFSFTSLLASLIVFHQSGRQTTVCVSVLLPLTHQRGGLSFLLCISICFFCHLLVQIFTLFFFFCCSVGLVF